MIVLNNAVFLPGDTDVMPFSSSILDASMNMATSPG